MPENAAQVSERIHIKVQYDHFTMSYKTKFHTTLYQHNIHIIVSRENVSYDNHLHFCSVQRLNLRS